MKTSPLIARMLEQMPVHPVGIARLQTSIIDTLGTLKVVSGTEAILRIPEGEDLVTIERSTRAYAEHNPRALWVADLRAGDATGTLSPFNPPRIERLDTAVPLRADDALRARLRELHLPQQGNILERLALPSGAGRVAILGMRTIAALDAKDARRVSWWVPDGGVLELIVDDDGAGGTVLSLVDLLKRADAHTANAGPNVLVHLGPRASLVLVGPSEGQGPVRSAVPVFHPPRSRLFDAWSRYATVARQEQEDRQAERGRHPITYTDATQQGGRWRARAHVSAETINAWLGASAREGRRERVDQRAALVAGDQDQFRLTVEEVTLRGPGQIDLLLKADQGVPVLPPSGTLAARENVGERVRLERERVALETLSKGAAACAQLPQLLAAPERATPPVIEALRPAPVTSMDESQERALQAIVGCVDLLAIQGPPGTGKTGVFAEALRQIAAKGRRDGRMYRVLVSSGQNEAITNLMQRLAGVDGVFVHVVERPARDEDEGFAFARRVEQPREATLAKLQERLDRSEIAGRLTRARSAADAVEEVRLAVAGGPLGWSRLAERLRVIADDDASPLGAFERDEARSIASALDARATAARPEVPSAETSAASPASRTPPAEPGEVSRWWETATGMWPPDHHAAVAAAVAEVTAASSVENALRRELGLKRALPRLSQSVAETRWPPPTAAPVPGPALEDRLDAWIATAARRVSDAGKDITASPEGVAWRFAQALREDPGAWKRILERHGNTVAATCSMAAKATPDPNEPYDWVIIDEAGHATPFELLIPMVQGRRVVLIGDHRQLPPMIDDAIVRRAAAEDRSALQLAGHTLFSELFRLLPRTNALRLGIQYRMHHAIGGIVDAVFYRPHGERVLTHFTAERPPSPKWIVEIDTPTGKRMVPRSRGMFGDAPVVWWDVPARRGCAEENDEEATAVVNLLQNYQRAGVALEDIAVICPYALQRARITSKLKIVGLPVQVRTIDSVQGREYPIVMLCLVRTDGGAGFLASPNRLNVAISRAQQQLVFVGSAGVFRNSKRVERNAPELRSVIEAVHQLHAGHRESP
jgi:hypothetical protein